MIEISSSETPADEVRLQRLDEAWNKVLQRPEVGFPRLADADAEWTALDQRLDDIHDVRRVLVVGIGGSSLGTQVIYEAFRASSAVQMFFLEAPSPHQWTTLRALGPDWLDNHTVIVSKSGNTLETLAWVERLAAQESSYLNLERCTVIASPGQGVLQEWAAQNNIPCLWIPTEVGGRFSVLTAAGMFPAGLMGLSLHEFRAGAEWALGRPRLASRLSLQALKSWERGEWVTQMWTYSEGLRFFGEWWQQLWSESLGKKVTRQGQPAPRVSTPMSCRGPRDQHSLVQQLMEGPNDKFVWVNRVTGVEEIDDEFIPHVFQRMPFYNRTTGLGQIMGAEADAFVRSLTETQIPYGVITMERINERVMGAMFMLWQMSIAQLGEHLGVNAFDQPGVEMGKIYANQILKGS